MSPLIIANWKMNFTLNQAIEACIKLSKNLSKNELIICAPAPYLAYLAARFEAINFGAQNVSNINNYSAFTGEYCASMLKSAKIDYALLGHSERRIHFNETPALILQKAVACLNAEIIPIICVGESLECRQTSNYQEFILEQLTASIPKMNTEMIIAYEPIWSIGTGVIPTHEQLVEIFDIIATFLKQSLVANKVRLVYGGSVSSNNIREILELPHVSGALLGKASLYSSQMLEILNF